MAQQQAKQTQTTFAQDPAALLEQVLANTTASQKTKIVADSLDKRIQTIRDLLPENLKAHAERFVKRAALFFSASQALQDCTPQSFIACVLKGAELGLAIDGRLAHAVPYKNKKKDASGKEFWVSEAQFQADYKGIIAVARRSKIIKDCYARIVCENDEFDAYEQDDRCHLTHRVHYGKPRGDVIGAYAKVILQDTWRYEWMDVGEIGLIRGRSKSGNYGPWTTDLDEMRKKTVLKRALKNYCEDPCVDLIGGEDDVDDKPLVPQSPPLGRSSWKEDAKPEDSSGSQDAIPILESLIDSLNVCETEMALNDVMKRAKEANLCQEAKASFWSTAQQAASNIGVEWDAKEKAFRMPMPKDSPDEDSGEEQPPQDKPPEEPPSPPNKAIAWTPEQARERCNELKELMRLCGTQEDLASLKKEADADAALLGETHKEVVAAAAEKEKALKQPPPATKKTAAKKKDDDDLGF